MKLRAIAAALGLLSAGPAFCDTFDLGVLDMSKPLYRTFSAFTGDFTDIYTFTLNSNTVESLVGDTTTINFGQWWNVDLKSATLTGTGLSLPQLDDNPNDGFSFHGLSGVGSYSLALNGSVSGTGLNGMTGLYAGYVSAVPEPQTVGLALIGLLATGVALRRRRG